MKDSAFDDFSEAALETLDFARCQRPDGSYYGTGGQCRKGSPAGTKEKAAPKAKKMSAAEKKDLQVKASKGDKASMKALSEARSAGRIGKESKEAFGPGAKESPTATAKASKDPAVQKRLLQTEIKKVSAKYEKLRGKPEAAAERKKLMGRADEIIKKLGKIDAAASKAAGPKKPDTSLPAQQRRSSAAARARD